MRLEKVKGKYVVAVSGGVDSIVLLSLLTDLPKDNLELVVAHFDHGIRRDSKLDRLFVEQLAKTYGLKFYYSEGHLGQRASEEEARNARYVFLNEIVKKEKADGLITAHHQDDQIETVIINIIRGTGRKGLSSLSSNKTILRPLLVYSKKDITNYALKNNLTWHEDPTNQDIKYLRNYIRRQIVPKLNKKSRTRLLDIINKQQALNEQIDKDLAEILEANLSHNQLPRLFLNSLDYSLGKELLASWLRQNGLSEFDRITIERLSMQLKTIGPKRKVDVYNSWIITSSKDNLALGHLER
jgi:tRNA(Ile)-lysidine synthetase-like protein